VRAARAMHEFLFQILRNPALDRRAGVMRQFPTGQLDSMEVLNVNPHNKKAVLEY
jgi:hypothetical protein